MASIFSVLARRTAQFSHAIASEASRLPKAYQPSIEVIRNFSSQAPSSNPSSSASTKRYALITNASKDSSELFSALVKVLLKNDTELKIFAVDLSKKGLDQVSVAYPKQIIPINEDMAMPEGITNIIDFIRSKLVVGSSLPYCVHIAHHPLNCLSDLMHFHERSYTSTSKKLLDAHMHTVVFPLIMTVALLPELKRSVPKPKVVFVLPGNFPGNECPPRPLYCLSMSNYRGVNYSQLHYHLITKEQILLARAYTSDGVSPRKNAEFLNLLLQDTHWSKGSGSSFTQKEWTYAEDCDGPYLKFFGRGYDD